MCSRRLPQSPATKNAGTMTAAAGTATTLLLLLLVEGSASSALFASTALDGVCGDKGNYTDGCAFSADDGAGGSDEDENEWRAWGDDSWINANSEERHYCANAYADDPHHRHGRGVDGMGHLGCYTDLIANATMPTLASTSSGSSFAVPNLDPGELFPFVWRDDGTRATEYAYQVGVPDSLVTALRDYMDRLGLMDLFRTFLVEENDDGHEDGGINTDGSPPTPRGPIAHDDSENKEEADGHLGQPTGRFVTLLDGHRWYAQRPAKHWSSNMHWVGPADEATHEDYLKVLGEGGFFDDVLGPVGTALGLDGLAAYHLTFIGVSQCEGSYVHHDATGTGGNFYNVIIPLMVVDEEGNIKDEEHLAGPEFVVVDAETDRHGAYKYKIGHAAMMGDDAWHRTRECNYLSSKGMRIAATMFIADVNERNAETISSQLTQVFPFSDRKWLLAQKGRHWNRRAEYEKEEGERWVDPGRGLYRFADDADVGCPALAAEGMCEGSATEEDTKWMRRKCPRSCGIFENYHDGDIEVDGEEDGVWHEDRGRGEEEDYEEDYENDHGEEEGEDEEAHEGHEEEGEEQDEGDGGEQDGEFETKVSVLKDAIIAAVEGEVVAVFETKVAAIKEEVIAAVKEEVRKEIAAVETKLDKILALLLMGGSSGSS